MIGLISQKIPLVDAQSHQNKSKQVIYISQEYSFIFLFPTFSQPHGSSFPHSPK